MKSLCRSIAILVLLFLPNAWAQCVEEAPCPELARLSPAMMGSVPVAAPADCPSGTYMFAWDAQYPASAYKGCKADGATTVTGTEVGTITVDSTNGTTINAIDEGLLFSELTSSEIPAATGTVWASVYCAATRSTSVHMLEIYQDAADRIGAVISTAGRVTLRYRGSNNNDDCLIASGQGCADATWCRWFGTWDSSLGDGSEKMKTGFTGKTAVNCTSLTLDTPGQPVYMIIGEPAGISATAGTTDTCYVKNVFIVSGYDTADPCPDANADGVCD